jgi:hypothetical protein
VVAHYKEFRFWHLHRPSIKQQRAPVKPSRARFQIIPIGKPQARKSLRELTPMAAQVNHMGYAPRSQILNVFPGSDRASKGQTVIYEECFHR